MSKTTAMMGSSSHIGNGFAALDSRTALALLHTEEREEFDVARLRCTTWPAASPAAAPATFDPALDAGLTVALACRAAAEEDAPWKFAPICGDSAFA